MTKITTISQIRPAGMDHQVVTVEGGGCSYRRSPCADCPWKISATGIFPAEAFRLSAHTAYDMSGEIFGCHQSGTTHPATCAGFLLRGGDHNLAVRLGVMSGKYRDDVSDDGHALHDDYRSMAQANGVDPADPVLSPCRESYTTRKKA
jgi:hypothetical protein